MSRDLNFSLANILADLTPTKRADRKGGDEQAQASAAANPTPFGKMVPDAARDVPAQRPAQPAPTRAKKLLPGQLSREQRALAQAKSSREASEAPAEPVRTADMRDERSGPCVGHKQQDSRTLDDGKPTTEASEKAIAEVKPEAAAEPKAGAETSGPDGAPEVVAAVVEQVVGDVSAQDLATMLLAAEQAVEVEPAVVVGGVPVAAMPADMAADVMAEEPVVAVAATADAKTKLALSGKTDNTVDVELDEATPADADGKPAELPRSLIAEKAADLRGARQEEGKQGIGEEISAFAKAQSSQEGEGVKAKSTAPNLHPTRSAQFAEILEGFSHVSAVHRPVDILAGLDRPVAAAAHNRPSDVQRPTPLQMLPIEIGMQAVRGVSNFQIRLDPAELGRVDVHLQISDDGEINASLVVDRVETLQMLKRDASTLQYAFEQAGLRQSADGLSFSLRGEGQNGQQQENGKGGSNADAADEANLQTQIGEIVMRRALIPNSSVDLMV